METNTEAIPYPGPNGKEKKKRNSYSLVQKMRLVRKVNALMRADKITAQAACAVVGVNPTTYYSWARDGKSKRIVRRSQKVVKGTTDGVESIVGIIRLIPLHGARISALESEWASFKKAIGVKPEDVGK